ncbi:hypothetical protein Q2K19_28910 [Micromonospora soli]|uniref:hypothetical protein n=1 Tax=Micromonospora sp. NBRC 110009 TaxID=3061627 RepID=UPI002672D43F|nr:hypothetical protein [Micromonospora sp. NBRC 110009]WKT98144.1 hypothetical protein Q2K19_28910 [Micromonospora sp. NBRC 110009]
MARLFTWVVKNLDAFIGLLIAVTVAVLGLTNAVSQEVVNSAILLILALLAQSMLRDRLRRETAEHQVRNVLTDTRDRLTELVPQMHEITGPEGALNRAREAIDSVSMVRVLHGSEVGQALAEARRHTDRWTFKGGTGTYTRAVTLPECLEHARRRNGTLHVALEIIDPTDEEICERYARFRRSLAPDAREERWTVDRTRKESYATVLAACWHLQRSGLLTIDVRLSAQMTTFRYDLSSTCVIITQENPQTPALRIDRKELYYNRYNIELQYSREQSRRVPIEAAAQVKLDDEPSVEQVRRLFTALGLPLPRSFGDREVADIVGRAIQARNPYA